MGCVQLWHETVIETLSRKKSPFAGIEMLREIVHMCILYAEQTLTPFRIRVLQAVSEAQKDLS